MSASGGNGGSGGDGVPNTSSGHSTLTVPVLGLSSRVVFPGLLQKIEVRQETLDHMLSYAKRSSSSSGRGGSVVGSSVAFVALRPGTRELYEVGTLCRVQSLLPISAEEAAAKRVPLLVEGLIRIEVLQFQQMAPLPIMLVHSLPGDASGHDADAPGASIALSIHRATSLLLEISERVGSTGQWWRPTSPEMLASLVGAALPGLSLKEQQCILAASNDHRRLDLAWSALKREAAAADVGPVRWPDPVVPRPPSAAFSRRPVAGRQDSVRSGTVAEKTPQDKAEKHEEEDELAKLDAAIKAAGMPKDARRLARQELKQLRRMSPQNPQYIVSQTYVETLASLPWKEAPKDNVDLASARAILDEDHCGLEEVKMRILEFLAVQKMSGGVEAPLLCLCGPPGVGKTSLGRSIARALDRKLHRLALGGVTDEAELRGHRRTYIGSFPGVVIQGLQACGVRNPVMVLDEVDKLAKTATFNPQAVLLEILDKEQNREFKDHYLGAPFDLSQVLFICTANEPRAMDRALLDRMELIHVPGYSAEEKAAMVRRHLLPKQLRMHALTDEACPPQGKSPLPPQQGSRLEMTDEAIATLIEGWTAEGGVRSLERLLAQICRWAAFQLQDGGTDSCPCITVGAPELPDILGPQRVGGSSAARSSLDVGVAMCLAASGSGSMERRFVEVATAPARRGSSAVTLTGQGGSQTVVRESLQTAISVLRSLCASAPLLFGAQHAGTIPFDAEDLHVHLPPGDSGPAHESSACEDGPSLGLPMFLALASLLLRRPLRGDTAAAGEVTLSGRLLTVPGARDRVLAARRAGIRHVLLPTGTLGAPQSEDVEVHYVRHAADALAWALGASEQPILPRNSNDVEGIAMHSRL